MLNKKIEGLCSLIVRSGFLRMNENSGQRIVGIEEIQVLTALYKGYCLFTSNRSGHKITTGDNSVIER
jgi:hypothetical protein